MNWKRPLRIATWNVRIIYEVGAAKVLEPELAKYRIDIAALQEIRWTGIGKLDQERGVILYSGRDDGDRVERAGIYPSKRAYGALMEFTLISSRRAKIRLNAKWFNIPILCLHAYTEITDEVEKDKWYDPVQSEKGQIPRHDVWLILGDVNAKIGKEVNAFQGTISLHSLHQGSNDNVIRLASFALQNSMVIRVTIFPHKYSHKGTWISPDGNTINQIDHIMIKNKFISTLFDARAFRGADCDSDLMLVVGKLTVI
ncbi:craniofacial development protein 2-like [Palaemon carinicauda]|uniref:craniofacial development protein 2-like n=1 Tax=Palaemon carinicauda TaxID=392227 RepID=UPI0035B5B135